MLAIQNIHKSFNNVPILNGVNLHLDDNSRLALVGENGSGKTTLLKIAVGELLPDQGQISGPKQKIGYLPQDIEVKNLENVDNFLGAIPLNEKQRYLHLVGLEKIDPETMAQSLSGGEKTRLGLAKLLSSNPTTLIMDEPTNNLDKAGLDWLSSFFKSFEGAILFTSHDRAFIDDTATKTAELSDGKIRVYGGNYTFMRNEQKREKDSYKAKYDSQEEYKNRLLKDIQNTKEQSLSVEQSTIDCVVRRYSKKVARKAVVREARLNREMQNENWLSKPFDEDEIYLPMPETSLPKSKLVLELKNISKAYGNKKVLEEVNLEIFGPERMQITGLNGSGKSTLLNIISNKINPDAGELKIGIGIQIGYLSQDLDGLNLSKTGKEELFNSNIPPTKSYQFVKAFGLEIADLSKPIQQLSRGQQTKMALIKVLLQSPNLLILDEPTNHVELEAREAMEQSLKGYKGSILIVSHDQYFINALEIDRVFEIKTLLDR